MKNHYLILNLLLIFCPITLLFIYDFYKSPTFMKSVVIKKDGQVIHYHLDDYALSIPAPPGGMKIEVLNEDIIKNPKQFTKLSADKEDEILIDGVGFFKYHANQIYLWDNDTNHIGYMRQITLINGRINEKKMSLTEFHKEYPNLSKAFKKEIGWGDYDSAIFY